MLQYQQPKCNQGRRKTVKSKKAIDVLIILKKC